MTTAPADMALPSSLHAQLPGAHRLADWGVIRAHGPDARSFLHGQLTQDILHLAPGRHVLAGYCSAKGRLLASFVAWAGSADDEVLLAGSADLLAPTLKRLRMFVLRAKCTLEDASAAMPLWGLAGDGAWGQGPPPQPPAVLGTPAGDLIALPSADGVPRWLWAGAPDGAAPALPTLADGAWDWLEVASGVPRITAANVEQFVPQMVNLELVGGVNFQKGCYPGQEVVARSQYRGTLKRRLFRVEAAGPLQPGNEVFHSGDPGQPAGRVVNAATWAPAAGTARHAALVELKLEAAAGGSLHAGAPGGPALTLAALPYEVPRDSSHAA